jgi:Rieske Fe-S protein
MSQQMRDEASQPSAPMASRRAVLAGAAVAAAAVVGGCATYDQNAPASGSGAGAGGGVVDPPGTSSGTAGASGGADTAKSLASTADIPVGGGAVFEQVGVVVTQPKAGSFKAFSAVCTHAGCLVAEVKDGTINCPCHGSKFKIADGAVATGPARSALKSVTIAVDGTNIRLA